MQDGYAGACHATAGTVVTGQLVEGAIIEFCKGNFIRDGEKGSNSQDAYKDGKFGYAYAPLIAAAL